MATEQGRALRRYWSTKPRNRAGRPKGVPDGFRREQIEPIRAKAKKEAEQVVKIMAEQYGIEDNYAQEALQTAGGHACSGETRKRLAAARLVLDFTKTKPVAKSEVTIGKAEEFLSSLLEDDGQETTADT